MFALVHQFTALTAGQNPWGGIACGVDSGTYNTCTEYVEQKSTPFEEVLPAHAPFCPVCVRLQARCLLPSAAVGRVRAGTRA
jgi:hypothetical protein